MASIINGLFSGRSGISGHGAAIAVLADNISNSNTVGFKASRPEFSDLVAGNSGGSGIDIGSGSSLVGTTQVFSQQTFEITGRSLDVAIDGNGFFTVQDRLGQRLYTRAGNFKTDAEGNLLTQGGLDILGFPVGGNGGLEPLNINDRTIEQVSTQNVTIAGNMDASAGIIAAAAIPDTDVAGTVTYADLSANSQFSTFVEIFDSLGGRHEVTVHFFHTDAANREWVVRAYVNAGDIVAGTPSAIDGGVSNAGADGEPFAIGEFTMAFNADGTRTAVPVPPAFDIQAQPVWDNGADPNVTVDFIFDPMTQFSTPSNISQITQDGAGGGSPLSFDISTDGTVFALLDNGQLSEIGKLALTIFANPEGLGRLSGSLLRETISSGEPVIGTPDTGQFGALEGEALELSSSDLAADFIKLISLQRGFQGRSRIVTSIDELLNEIINLA